MDRRSAFRLTIVALMALLAAPLALNESAGAQSTLPNPQTGMLPDPPLPGGVTYAYVNSQSFFGTPCCIRTQSVAQGALGDCFFISALDALAMSSPGTIEKAIRYNPVSNTFTLTFYVPPPSAAASTNTAWVRHTYTTDAQVPVPSAGSQFLNWTFPFVHPIDGLTAALSTVHQPKYVNSPNGTLWPLLLEKGYAATQPDGYASLDKGGFGFDALRALTGASGDRWNIIDKPVNNVLRSVTVTNVSSLADRSGHGVIAGIFEGKGLTGIEPRIQVCVSPIAKQGSRAERCTPVCKPGYECTTRFQSDVPLYDDTGSLMVEVLDVPDEGTKNQVVIFKKDPGKCTAKAPCQEQPLDPHLLADANVPPVSISFETSTNSQSTDPHALATLDALASKLAELAGRPLLAGSIPDCPESVRCADENKPGPFDRNLPLSQRLIGGHEYYVKKYMPSSDPKQATVVLGNPWGVDVNTGVPLRDVKLSLPNFQSNFITLSTSYVIPVPASATCSCK
jgi:hypothetical protein